MEELMMEIAALRREAERVRVLALTGDQINEDVLLEISLLQEESADIAEAFL